MEERLKRALELVAGDRGVRRGPRLPRLRAALRVRLAPPPDEYPFNDGRIVSSRGLDMPGLRLRGALHRGARPARERAALRAQGLGRLPRRPARPLQPQLRAPARGRTGRRAGGRPRSRLQEPVPEHRRPRGGAASSPATRRCASSPPTSRPSARSSRSSRATPRATAPPRRRAGCSTTATRSAPTAWCARPRSCRRRRRTRRRSRTTSGTSSPPCSTCRRSELTWRCEQAIRNYDPCISCATHFLKLDLRGE